MTDTCRIMSENAASQVKMKVKGGFKVMLLALTSQLEQALGNSVNQTSSQGEKIVSVL